MMAALTDAPFTDVAAVILAAGKGTRMKSERAKVLHEILGRSMILHVLETAAAVFGANIVVVVGHQGEQVQQVVEHMYDTRFARQNEQKGTGHAVLAARSDVPADCGEIVVLCGDVPLVKASTLFRFVQAHQTGQRDVSVLATRRQDPTGYGRLLLDAHERVCGIVEEADASDVQKKIDIVNTGIYCVKKRVLFDMLAEVKDDNAQGELYLTDIIGIGHRRGLRMGMMLAGDPFEFTGVNSVDELQTVEAFLRRGKSNKA